MRHVDTRECHRDYTADRHQFEFKARSVEGGKGEKSEVKAHSIRGQPRMVENACPVQVALRRLSFASNPKPREMIT